MVVIRSAVVSIFTFRSEPRLAWIWADCCASSADCAAPTAARPASALFP